MTHLWDTEPLENVTYTPPAHHDGPWVIRMCCGCETPNCKALLIDQGNGPAEYVHVDTHDGQCQADYARGLKEGREARAGQEG